jgi:hypothetical protein
VTLKHIRCAWDPGKRAEVILPMAAVTCGDVLASYFHLGIPFLDVPSTPTCATALFTPRNPHTRFLHDTRSDIYQGVQAGVGGALVNEPSLDVGLFVVASRRRNRPPFKISIGYRDFLSLTRCTRRPSERGHGVPLPGPTPSAASFTPT